MEEIKKEQEQENKKVEDFISSNEQGIKNPTPSLTRVNGLLVEKISEKFLQKESEEGDELESDEEQDTSVFDHLFKEESYSFNNLLLPKYSFKELTQNQLTKVYDLKVLTEEAIARTVKNKNSSNIVKALVSKKKNRFCYDGFDLDLTYITPRIIAMGFPSTSLEGIYRNNMEDVKRFFTTRHKDHYKVYNLCGEKTYPKDTFYKQSSYPFPDHEAPPLNLFLPFCQDAKAFLDEDEKNIVAIHCKAGKGRTGTFVCALMLYLNIFKMPEEALAYYGIMRVANGKGVTIPSQIRYVNYKCKSKNNND